MEFSLVENSCHGKMKRRPPHFDEYTVAGEGGTAAELLYIIDTAAPQTMFRTALNFSVAF